MATGNYGFKSVQNRLTTVKNSNYAINSAKLLDYKISIEKVTEVVLDDSKYDGWTNLGYIKTNRSDEFIAPLYTNIKTYPVINELVVVFTATSDNINNNPYPNYNEDVNLFVPSRFYASIFRATNNTNCNALSETNETTNKTFKQNPNIQPLQPFEGDIIYEGRWGNSIRFSSTIKDIRNDFSQNNWSEGENKSGDPVIIIRNGQGDSQEFGSNIEIGNPTIEDITKDLSSIYLTSTQKIPLEASTVQYISYSGSIEPITPKEYSKPQIILDSGRLVFNSWEDHILLSSAKSINLNSIESVNIDTNKFVIQSSNIYLGIPQQATYPLIYGDLASNILRDIVKILINLNKALQTLNSDPVINGSPATFSSLVEPTTTAIINLQAMVDNLLGADKTTCRIISQRNFTM